MKKIEEAPKLRTVSYFDGREAEYYIDEKAVSLDEFRTAVKPLIKEVKDE